MSETVSSSAGPVTAVLTIIRNEMDLLPAWLAHTRELFDHVYIVDHLSDDGSAEFLQAWAAEDPAVRVFSYRETVYDRERIIRTLRRLVLQETAADWLFILDPDEFLPYDSVEAFHHPLREATGKVVLYRWRNCLPASPGPVTAVIPLHRQTRLSGLGKVAISREVAADPLVRIPRGAHNVVHRDTGSLPAQEIGELFHLPFRSLEQAWLKVLRGTVNRLRILQRAPASGNNWHYVPLLNLMAERPEWSTVLQLVYDYGEPDSQARVRANLSAEALAGEFEEHELRLVGAPPTAALAPRQNGDHAPTSLPINDLMTHPSHRTLLEELMTLNSKQGIDLSDQLKVTPAGDMVYPADFSRRMFSVLEEGASPSIDIDRVTVALRASHADIDHVPGGSAWGTHIPFLFSLVTLLEPRTYVELGVQAGASFFAACQAVQRHELATTCVAVDNWIGDPHAGQTADGEFDNVRNKIAAKYEDFAGYIRGDFSEALSCFEPGSIDLLHIDGFHTEEAVTNDFTNWLDRMSDRGVIIFHDINEFKSDFGVWRFWNRVKKQYPHIEFGHGHGLGVLVVGEKSPLLEPLSGTDVSLLSQEANELLQVMFGGLGHLSWGYAKEIRMHRSLKLEVTRLKKAGSKQQGKAAARPPARGKAGDASARQVRELKSRVRELRAELKSARANLSEAQAHVAALEQSTSWRVTRPMRYLSGKLRTRS